MYFIQLILWLMWRMMLWAVLLSTLFVLILLILFARLSHYQTEIETWLSTMLQQPVSIKKIDTYWSQGQPILTLKNVDLLDPRDQHDLITINQLNIQIDLFTSLYDWQLITEDIILKIHRLTLVRQIDGSIHVVGLADGETKEPIRHRDVSQVFRWILQQTHIQVETSQLIWQERQQAPLILRQIHLSIRQIPAKRHLINGQLLLPLKKGKGKLRFATESHWQQAQLLQLVGDIDFEPINNPILPSIAGELRAVPGIKPHSWQLYINQLHVHTPRQTWTPNTLQLKFQPTRQGFIVHSQLSFLILDELMPWLMNIAPDHNSSHYLKTVATGGNLYDIQMDYTSGQRWAVTTHFKNLTLRYKDSQISQLAGQMSLGGQSGQLELSHAKLKFQDDELYSHPLNINNIQGNIQWQQTPTGRQVSIPQLTGQHDQTPIEVMGDIKLPPGKEPILDLMVQIGQDSVKQVAHYLPDKKLDKTVDWLQKSLLKGYLTDTQLRLNGSLDNVFKLEKKQFQLSTNLKQVDLRYIEDWPILQDIDAKLHISDDQLTVTSQKAHLFNSQIRDMTVSIPQLSADNLMVVVQGKINSFGEDALRFIANSPLRDQIPLNKDLLDVEGPLDLELDLQIPLGENREDKIEGKVQFNNNWVKHVPSGLILTEVNGSLFFTKEGVKSQGLRARLLNEPIVFSVNVQTGEEKAIIDIRGQGKFHANFLRKLLTQLDNKWADWNLYPHLIGRTTRHTHIQIVKHKNQPEKDYINIATHTDFYDMSLTLPPPLNKISPIRQPFTFNLYLPEQGNDTIRFRYGDLINGILSVDELGLERGTILCGTRVLARLPNNQKLMMSGHLPFLPLLDWREWIFQWPTDDSPGRPLIPLTIDLRLDTLQIASQHFQTVQVHLHHAEQRWQATIRGQGIKGELRFNAMAQPTTVHLNFQLLHLRLPPETEVLTEVGVNSPDPRTLPALSLHADRVIIDQIELGNVNLFMRPRVNGLAIEVLETKSQGLHTFTTGRWYYYPPRHHKTVLEIEISSQDTAEFFKRIGYAQPPLVGGHAEILLNIYWPDALNAFSLKTLQGNLRLLVTEGQIVDIEPGHVGRIIGLFDLRALPKRLTLDFRDVFDEGLIFTTLVGAFSIQEGVASIKNVILQAPVARVEISGQTNLIEKTYDQVVTLYPHVSNTLPVAGALVGGLGVGAVALIIQKLLEGEIEKTINYQYRITGSWKKPKITPFSTE